MRADRLVAILLLLQRHGTQTARELSEQLEVSERTILRDMVALSTSGVPVYAERGASGGFRLMEGFRLDLTGLRSPEIRALLLPRKSHIMADLGWNQDARAAWDKVTSAIAEDQKSIATELGQRLYIDEAAWFQKANPTPCLRTLLDALWQDRRIHITHQRADGTVSERTISPYALVAKSGLWYLVAERDNQMRVYRVSRILRVEPREESFERAAAFDLEQFWTVWVREFESGRSRYDVELWITQHALSSFMQATPWLTVDGEIHVEDGAPEGYVGVRLTFETAEVACRHITGFGDHVRVIDPPELRTMVVERARQVARLYGGLFDARSPARVTD